MGFFMKNSKSIFTMLIAIGTITFWAHADLPNFKITNTSNTSQDLEVYISDIRNNKRDMKLLAKIEWNDEYSGPIPLNDTTCLTIFSGMNIVGRDFWLKINPKKTENIFLHWDNTAKMLFPEKAKIKRNITSSEIIKIKH
jgi:hypothetical protein